MDQELTALIPDDVAFFIGSKLRYFFQHRAYGEIRIKIAEGLPHTYHYTESYRAKKRTRRTDTPTTTVTASQSQD